MKKYVIGLFSAICLMGAGCDKMEEFTPTDMGEGPSVSVRLTQQEGEDDAFTMTVTPADGTVYYAYMLTSDSLTLNADTLLQGGYKEVTVVKAAEKPSVTEEFTAQKVGVTYYVYAVAANKDGLCGAIASASLHLPDKIAPHLINIPDGYKYTATNKSRSIVLTFNETVVRGNGAITYDVTKGDLTSYASGTIETVVIDGSSVTITLPESVVFNEDEPKTYVFLDFAAGAFVDASGNQSAAMKGGVIDNLVSAPFWEYIPAEPGGSDVEWSGTFAFWFCPYDFETQQPDEKIYGIDTEFSRKHENNPDTLLIDFQNYFGLEEPSPLPLEAIATETGFKVRDLTPIGVLTMKDQQGTSYNLLFCFAGNPNNESDSFEYVNFEPDEDGNYESDHYCGFYIFNYDYIDDYTNPNFDMGWFDLWVYSVFIEGSADNGFPSAQAKSNSPWHHLMNKKDLKLINRTLLSDTEKIKVQTAIKRVGIKNINIR